MLITLWPCIKPVHVPACLPAYIDRSRLSKASQYRVSCIQGLPIQTGFMYLRLASNLLYNHVIVNVFVTFWILCGVARNILGNAIGRSYDKARL